MRYRIELLCILTDLTVLFLTIKSLTVFEGTWNKDVKNGATWVQLPEESFPEKKYVLNKQTTGKKQYLSKFHMHETCPHGRQRGTNTLSDPLV